MLTFTCVFITWTLTFTTATTICLTLGLLSDRWEYIRYDPDMVGSVATSKNHSIRWVGSGLVRVDTSTMDFDEYDNVTEGELTSGIIYLVSAHGGVNSLCTELTNQERNVTRQDGIILPKCISYLTEDVIISKGAVLDRMRNLAMSCGMVSLILLGTATTIGILGLLKKQISTIMVTGVMYLLSGIFGIFTLTFMYFKRKKWAEDVHYTTLIDKDVPADYLKTRVFTVGEGATIGWAGLSLCIFTSILWLLLARVLRYQVLSPT